MKRTVLTLAVNMALKASWFRRRPAPSAPPVLSHTKAAMAATNSSKIIPPAPTAMRRHLLGKAQHAEAST